MAATVDIGDDGGVGVVLSPSGHGQEKRGGGEWATTAAADDE